MPAKRGGERPRAATSTARREGWLRRLPLLPAFIYVFLITQVPFAITLGLSLFNFNLRSDTWPPTASNFVGLANYRAAAQDPAVRDAIANSVVLTASSVIISVILGVAIAILLNRDLFAKGLMRTLMIGPFLVMPTAAAIFWKDSIFHSSLGILDYVLSPIDHPVHAILSPIVALRVGPSTPFAFLSPFLDLGHMDWIGKFPMASIVAVTVWQWTPFMFLIALAGLQSQNTEVLEAASIDGANAWRTLRYITLPLLRPFIELGALLGSIFILQTFDAIFVMTSGGGGTGDATTNIPFKLYLVAFEKFDIGMAAAIGVVSVLLTWLVAMSALRMLFSIFHVEARR